VSDIFKDIQDKCRYFNNLAIIDAYIPEGEEKKEYIVILLHLLSEKLPSSELMAICEDAKIGAGCLYNSIFFEHFEVLKEEIFGDGSIQDTL